MTNLFKTKTDQFPFQANAKGLKFQQPRTKSLEFIHLNRLKQCQTANLTKSRGQPSFPLESPGPEAILEGGKRKTWSPWPFFLFSWYVV